MLSAGCKRGSIPWGTFSYAAGQLSNGSRTSCRYVDADQLTELSNRTSGGAVISSFAFRNDAVATARWWRMFQRWAKLPADRLRHRTGLPIDRQ